jgi:hypothetical protein
MVCGTIPVAQVVNTIVDRLCRFGVAHKELGATQRKPNMLELTMYGLVGLAAMLVIVSYFAYRDESARPVPGSDAIPYSRSRGALLVNPGLPSDREEEYPKSAVSGK